MSEECKKYLRQPTKEILVRVARKFGAAVVTGLVPEDDRVMQKRLKNIRKELERKARARTRRNSEDLSNDDDIDTEFSLAKKPQTYRFFIYLCTFS
jgi:hypothetical protein